MKASAPFPLILCVLLVLAVVGCASNRTGAPPALLQGQTYQATPAPQGSPQRSIMLTVRKASFQGREVRSGEPTGRDLDLALRSFIAQMHSSHPSPAGDPSTLVAPAPSFRAVTDIEVQTSSAAASNFVRGFISGILTLGMANVLGGPEFDSLTKLRLEVDRSDGARRVYTSEGKANARTNDRLSIPPQIQEIQGKSITQGFRALLDQVARDTDFWMGR